MGSISNSVSREPRSKKSTKTHETRDDNNGRARLRQSLVRNRETWSGAENRRTALGVFGFGLSGYRSHHATKARENPLHSISSLPSLGRNGISPPSRILNRLSTSTHLRCVPVGASICSRPQMSRSRGNRTARTSRPAGANRNAVFRNFYFTNGQAEHRVRGGMESLVMCVPVSARHGSCRVAKERR